MSVRAIDPENRQELEALLAMCVEHADFERSSFEDTGQIERWRQHLAGDRLRVFLAEADGEILGFAAVSLEYSTWRAEDYLHLDCLFLREQARGLGLGTRLFEAVKSHARDAGCREVQWQTPPWNEKAIGFYLGRGADSQPKLRFSLTP